MFTFVQMFTKNMANQKNSATKDERLHIAVTADCKKNLINAKANYMIATNEDPSWPDFLNKLVSESKYSDEKQNN